MKGIVQCNQNSAIARKYRYLVHSAGAEILWTFDYEFVNLHDNRDDRRSRGHSHHHRRLIHVTNDQCVHSCLNDRSQPIHRMPLQSNTMRSNNSQFTREKRKFCVFILAPHLVNPKKNRKDS